MSYVGYGQTVPPQQQRSGQIRMEAIGEAWALVREQMGVWVLTMLLYIAIIMGVSLVVNALSGGLTQAPAPPNPDPAYFISLMSRSTGSTIVNTILGAFFAAGLFRMALKQIRGESIGIGDLFSGGDAILPMIGANLLIGLITYAVMLITLIPMFVMMMSKNSLSWIPIIFTVIGLLFLNARLFLVPTIVADGRGGALGSIKESFAATSGQTLNAFLFLLVLSLWILLAAIPCGLGLLFVGPIVPVAIGIVYQDLFGLEGGMRGPQLDIPLPPSNAYGSTPPGLPGQPPPYGSVPNDMQGRGNTAMPGTPPPPGQNPPPAPGQMGQIQM